MPKLIIGLAGKIASGKGTVAAYLQAKYQAEIFGFSTPLRDILKRLYLEASRPNLAGLSSVLRSQFGQDLLSRAITQDLQTAKSDIAVLDGIRRLPDIEQARQLPNFKLVQVITDENHRYERLTKRQQNPDDATKTFEDFLIDDQKESDRQIPDVMALADFTINNDGDLNHLQTQVDELLAKLL
jgi:dephospho-CoA kinase